MFSKWFFAVLFLISLFDAGSDIAERVRMGFWGPLNSISIGLSVVVAFLAGWMFIDLHTRRSR